MTGDADSGGLPFFIPGVRDPKVTNTTTLRSAAILRYKRFASPPNVTPRWLCWNFSWSARRPTVESTPSSDKIDVWNGRFDHGPE
jgi:hypothetical protein